LSGTCPVGIGNPVTGKVEKRIKTAHEHVRVAADELRIVDDETWFRAARTLTQLEDEAALQFDGC
jgi:hypothetical protein